MKSEHFIFRRKLKTIFKPNILWIAFGILIFIGLTLLIVLPIIILANKGTNLFRICLNCIFFDFV